MIFSRLARRAAVATDVSGVRDFIEHGVSGFVRPLRDAPGLARDILTLLSDPDLAGRMGRAGFDKARAILDENHILKQMGAMYRGIYEERFGEARGGC